VSMFDCASSLHYTANREDTKTSHNLKGTESRDRIKIFRQKVLVLIRIPAWISHF
jgi:hypothetical protein